MPRFIKPRMSKDELEAFDLNIDSVQYDDGEALLSVKWRFSDNGLTTIYLNESDCDAIIQFIRRNKL